MEDLIKEVERVISKFKEENRDPSKLYEILEFFKSLPQK